MIFKNNEPYRLSKEEIALHSKRVVYLLHQSLVQWDYQDQRLRKPNTLMMEPYYSMYDADQGQTVEVRYAHTIPQKKLEGSVPTTVWNPSEIEFPKSGRLIVEANNPEFNYFLANHPSNEANENRPTHKTPQFFPQNRAALASKSVAKQKLRFEAEALIFHPTEGLKDIDLKMVAKSYPDLVGFADTWTMDELKDALRVKAIANPELFMKAAKSPKTKARFTINNAISSKLLAYNMGKKTWYKKEDEQEKEIILTVKQGDDPMDALIEFLMIKDKKDYLKYFETALNAEPVVD